MRGRKRRAPALDGEATVEDHWEATLENLPTNFFTSREARMLEREPFAERGYASLPLTHENNHDVKRFYQIKIETSALQGRIPTQYESWLRTWGQYARCCIAGRVVSKTNLVKEGYLFQCFTNRDFLKMFLGYYGVRGQPGTVGRQAQMLNKLCNIAHSYFLSIGKIEEAGLIQENAEVSHATLT